MQLPLITLSHITKQYGTALVTTSVLRDVSLTVKQGEFIAIVGPSGSGKSTLMNIIGLLDVPSAGTYYLFHQDVTTLSEDHKAYIRNKTIGFVFQAFNLLPKLSAIDNVILPAIYAGVDPVKRSKYAKELLVDIGLGKHLGHRPNQLSGGQQQRVAIARALINEPQLILADEPTGNLDTKSGADVMKILQKLNKNGKTIVMITHERDIAKCAKRIIYIRDGKVVGA